MTDHPEIRRVAALEQEIADYAGTVAALDAKIADLKEQLADAVATAANALECKEAADAMLGEEIRRGDRFRSRLARVLQLVKADRDWVGIPCGGVWSRHALTPQSKGDTTP